MGGRGEKAVLVDDQLVEGRVEILGTVEVDVERRIVEAGLGADRRYGRGIRRRAVLEGRLDELFLLREVVGIGNGRNRSVWIGDVNSCSGGREV